MSHHEPLPEFSVTTQSEGESITVTIVGELDAATAPDAQQCFDEIVRDVPDRRPTTIEANLAAVTFIDSTGLTVLIRTAKALQALGHTLVLRDPSPPSQRVLDIAGLDPLFLITRTDEA